MTGLKVHRPPSNDSRGSMYEVSDKVIFITGGAHGSGKAYTQALLDRGAKVFIADRDPKACTSAMKEFRKRYGAPDIFHTCSFDLSNKEKFEEAFHDAVAKFGHVDVMVNNASVLNEGTWEVMIQTNFTSTVIGTKIALEHMRRDRGGRGGRIINVSSSSSFVDDFTKPVYVGTKHAVRAFTSSIAARPELWRTTGVELACFCPDTSGADLINEMDHVEHPGLFSGVRSAIQDRMFPISVMTAAFLKLLQGNEINGALLYVTANTTSFKKIEMVDLGEDFPKENRTEKVPEQLVPLPDELGMDYKKNC